jgi:hypothetical protein
MAQEVGTDRDALLEKTVKEAEGEIDRSFASSALKNEGYAQAVWTLLSMNEEYSVKVMSRHPEDLDIFADTHMNALTYPLRVCQRECINEPRKLVKKLINQHYQLVWDWIELAVHGYLNFHTLFPLWHRGKLELTVEEKRLIVTTPRQNKAYEAYNRLFPKDAKSERAQNTRGREFSRLVAPKTTVGNDWFRVNFDPQLVAGLVSLLTPVVRHQHSLPDGWTFAGFTLGQFKAVMITVQAMMTGWFTARYCLAKAGMPGMGYTSSIWVVSQEELAARLHRYTSVEVAALKTILGLLTFGSSDIRNPDIATQPLIDLRNGDYALSPFVWMGTNPERNFCALLNQIPAHRKIYSRLINEKETLLRKEIEDFLAPLGLDARYGALDGTDLDLGIVDRKGRCCLCLELKWFIEPAEIREIEERTEELKSGIVQAKKLRALFERKDERLLRDVLGIESDYRFSTAVASHNWIGHAEAQDEDVPIIKVWHLLHQIRKCSSLHAAIDWLAQRKFLPVEGIDFNVQAMKTSCGAWTCDWYGIEPLTSARESGPEGPAPNEIGSRN